MRRWCLVLAAAISAVHSWTRTSAPAAAFASSRPASSLMVVGRGVGRGSKGKGKDKGKGKGAACPPEATRGTRAPDRVVLQRLVGEAGDPLGRPAAPRSERLDPELTRAATQAGGRCVYIPDLCCPSGDLRALEALALDIAGAGGALVPHLTRKRLQVFGESLQDSDVFRSLVARMMGAFADISLVDCWVNVYRDGRETTGWHQDHYNLREPNPGATLNLNLGATRSLALEHMATRRKFYVPQVNGGMFAFDAGFNAAFRHAVPTDKRLEAEPGSLRLSITAFVRAGPPSASVARDAGNVPPGVPLTATYGDWSPRPQDWEPRDATGRGAGGAALLESGGPLLRGHDRSGARGQRPAAAAAAAAASPRQPAQERRSAGLRGKLSRPPRAGA